MTQRLKNFLVNIALASSVTIVLAAFGEIVLRAKLKAWPFKQEFPLSFLTPKDQPLRYRHPPGNDRNSLGLKNREIMAKEGQLRILFLGDSLLWESETSSGVPFTAVLETNLNERWRGSGRDIEIINGGICGYTTHQELEFLKIYGLDMEPDWVVLVLCLNDLFEYQHSPTDTNYLDYDPRRHLHRFDTGSFPGSLVARSYLAHLTTQAAGVLRKKIMGAPIFPFEQETNVYLAWKPYGWTAERKRLKAMRELLQARRIRFEIICYPLQYQVDDSILELNRDYVLFPQAQLRDICEEFRVPLLDLTPVLHEKGGRDLFKEYIHLNGRGNDVIAATLTEHFSNRLSIVGFD